MKMISSSVMSFLRETPVFSSLFFLHKFLHIPTIMFRWLRSSRFSCCCCKFIVHRFKIIFSSFSNLSSITFMLSNKLLLIICLVWLMGVVWEKFHKCVKCNPDLVVFFVLKVVGTSGFSCERSCWWLSSCTLFCRSFFNTIRLFIQLGLLRNKRSRMRKWNRETIIGYQSISL